MVDIRKSKLFPFQVDEEVALRKLFNTVLQESSLNDLSDVLITNPSDGEVLKYNESLMLWENAADSGGSGGTPGGSSGQLQYNNAGAFGGIAGTAWDGTKLTIPASLQIGPSSTGTKTVVGTDVLTVQYNHPTNTGSYSKLEMGRTGSTQTGWRLEAIGDGGGDTVTLVFTSESTAPEFNGNVMWHAGNFDPTTKQNTLVSGTTLKTVGSTSLLGSGDVPFPVTSVNTRTGGITLTDTDVPATVVTESGTSRSMANADAGRYIRFTNTSAKTATFGTGLNVVGQEFHIRNVGTNNLTLTPSSTTLNAPAGGTLVVPPGGTVTVKQVASTEFDVFGTTT